MKKIEKNYQCDYVDEDKDNSFKCTKNFEDVQTLNEHKERHKWMISKSTIEKIKRHLFQPRELRPRN